MPKENDQVEIRDEDTQETDFSPEELADESIDWKVRAQELKGIAKRRATQLSKAKEKLKSYEAKPKEEPVRQPKAESQSGELDRGTRALLKSYLDISGNDELELAKTWMARTGDDVDVLVNDDIFKARLNSLREARAAKDALPSASKRSSSPQTNTVEYHLAKNTPLAEISDTKLRRDVLNMRLSQETDNTKFSSNPIINGS